MRTSGETLPSGTVTFLMADVEGSTRLWEAGAESMSASMQRFVELADETVSRHGGARPVEQGEGDSFVAGFERASGAVACALDLQLTATKEDWPGPAIGLRIGLHTGEARLRGEGRNYAGEAMNRCARLRNLGHGGQTLLSGATYELVVETLPDGVTLKDLGPHRLRDLQRPERVWQLRHPDLNEEFPPLRSLEAMPNNLPTWLTSFVGREKETAEVRELLAANRLVTLTGSGGVGKTRLAVEAAADLLDEYPDGVWWVDLAPTTNPQLVPKTIATAAQVREQPTRATADALLADLEDKRVLLVLDNCEHLTEACAELAERLVTRCPCVRVLATSREPLGVPGEVPWRVPSLGLPRAEDDVADAEAVRLFTDRARSSRPNFKITEDNARAVTDICRQLEGIPLAIELAAARVRVLTPAQIASGLSDRFHLLTGGGPRALPRQRTLEASVDWSYNLLSEEEQRLLRRLSVFAGGFTLDATESVCADDSVDVYRVLDLLSALVDRSLVQMDDEGEEARYTLLETIRQYAAQKLVDAGEGAATGDRHLAYYLSFAEEASYDRVREEIRGVIARLEREHDNIRAGLDWAIRMKRDDEGLRLVSAMALFWAQHGHRREGRRRFTVALEALEGDPTSRSRALAWAAYLIGNTDPAASLPFAEAALGLAEQLEDQALTARALIGLGQGHLFGDPVAARRHVVRALSLARETRDPWSEFHALAFLGFLEVQSGNAQAARSAFEDALRLTSGSGVGRIGRMHVLFWLGSMATFGADLGTLEARVAEALSISRELRTPDMTLDLLVTMAMYAVMRGDDDRAESLFAEVDRLRQKLAAPPTPMHLVTRGTFLHLRGEHEAGLRELEQATTAARAMRFTWLASQTLVMRSFALVALGDLQSARPLADEAFREASQPRVPEALAQALLARGVVAREEGDEERAAALLSEALTEGAKAADALARWTFLMDVFSEIASLEVAEGRFADAARMFGAADSSLSPGFQIRRISGRDSRPDIGAARTALGDEAFEQAWAEGAAMSFEEAVAFAQRGRGRRGRPSAGWDSLTPRELNVVSLVAQGMTNPEIGEKLFLSKRTVQSHLSRIFAKVGVSSRAELASEATRREL